MSSAISVSVEDFTGISSDYPPQPKSVAPVKPIATPGGAVKSGERMLFIDGLRGVAAMFVVLFHFYTPKVSNLYSYLHDLVPSVVDWVLMQGYIGVEIFFVLSGFVIAYTLRDEVCTPRFAANFVVRRSIRLDPPYWTLILITVAYRCVLWHQYAGVIIRGWGIGTIVMNMFYVSELTHHLRIVGVAWTLCLEVQFYLAIMGMLVIAQQFRRLVSPRAGGGAFALLFMPLTAISLFYRYGEGTLNFLGTWYMFAMGVTLAWTLTKKNRERWLWVLLAAAGAGELWQVDFRAGVAVVTVLSIYTCFRLGKMSVWLSWSWLQKLGKISYSLYLCHIAVGKAVIDIFLTYSDKSRFAAMAAYIVATLLSILAATLLYKFVEAPCVRLAKRLKPARNAAPQVKEVVDRSINAVDVLPIRLAAVQGNAC